MAKKKNWMSKAADLARAGLNKARGIAAATKVRPGSKIGGKKIPRGAKYAISAKGGPVAVGGDHSRG